MPKNNVVEEEKIQEETGNYGGQDGPFDGNGPSKAQIEQWKATFGEIYASRFEDLLFIWRILTRTEYKEILRIPKADAMYREERICEKCVLWPEGYNHIMMASGKAGIPSLLAEQIMDKSGFTATGEPEKL